MTDSTETLRKTPLHALHIELGGKMVPFAGYDMPVQYPSGILKEHLHTREKAGLFDVSHMGQAFLSGADPARALERVTPADLVGLKEGMQRYGLLLNDAGGIKDDFMTTRLAGERGLYLVVNASMKESDFAYIAGRLKGVATLAPQPDRALLALQGPAAEAVLARHAPGIEALTFMKVARVGIAGFPAILSRTGYTGEDGFEIFCAVSDAEPLWQALLDTCAGVGGKPVGLGARDTLRLEARLPLYGNDISDLTTPLEAGLGRWVKLEKPQFRGKEALATRQREGLSRVLTGIVMDDRAVPRAHYPIADAAGNRLGEVTSGGFSPTLGKGIALAYLPLEQSAIGTAVAVLVRGQAHPATVVKTPFYRRPKKT